MPRGYQLALCAAFGWLALANAQEPAKQTQTSPAQQKQASPLVTAPAPAPSAQLPYRAYPDRNGDACYDAKDHDSADLCAQWRAALAAEKAAHESRRATTWSIVATILSFLGISGLGYTIWQTHGALREARRGNILAMRENARATRRSAASAKETAEALAAAQQTANAANRQAEIAQSASHAQLRSYLVIDLIEPFIVDSGEVFVRVHVKNAGLTPARVRNVWSSLHVSDTTIDPLTDCPQAERRYTLRDWLPQGGVDFFSPIFKGKEALAKINKTDRFDAHVYGRIEYDDIFDNERWMTFAYCLERWEFGPDIKFRPNVNGNDGN